MKHKDIKVGALYIHPEWPNTIYLGCGNYWRLGRGAQNKFLIVLFQGGQFGGEKVWRNNSEQSIKWWNKMIELTNNYGQVQSPAT